MKKLQKKWICLILLAIALCYVQPSIVQAKESMISLMYAQSNRCLTNLGFSGTTANCTLTVSGKKGTSSISGLLKLYDITSKKTVSSWSISTTGSVYRGTKTSTVKKGHSYKLSFSGKVYGKNNKYGESVSSTTRKKN